MFLGLDNMVSLLTQYRSNPVLQFDSTDIKKDGCEVIFNTVMRCKFSQTFSDLI